MHTPEQIEKWARESGISLNAIIGMSECLPIFADLVAQHERERAASVAEHYPRADGWIAEEIAAAIRKTDGG